MDRAALYQDIVEGSRDGVWVFDLEGRTLYANPEMGRLFGVDDQELARLTVFDSLDDVGRAQFAEHLEQLRVGLVNEDDVECKFVRQDGSALWMLVRETALRDDDGRITAVVHRLSDFSQRRSIHQSLLSSRRQLAEAQRIARIGSWEWDLDADRVAASEGLYALYGYTAEDFGGTYADFLAMVHPEDQHLVEEAVGRSRHAGEDFVFVVRVEHADGHWVWTRGRGEAHRDPTGRVTRMSGTHQDITGTKLAELALEDSVRQNALMQAVATAANEARTLEEVLDQARYLVLLHDDWRRGAAFVPTADRRGLVPLLVGGDHEPSDQDEVTPQVLRAEHALAERCFREGGSVWDEDRLTIAFPVRYGDEVCAVITITSAPPLYRHDMIATMVEQVAVQLGRVAERERAERELAAARDAAMEASRQKSEFLATMSHEIRTPLNGVIGLNDLLLRTRLAPDQLRLASGVRVASRALLGVINDVLDFSKIEAGKLQLERLDFEVRPVFDQVASLLAQSARAKGLDLRVSCHPDVPEVLSGDPTRLAQVLTNLGSNAVKFTERGEVTVRATAETLPVATGGPPRTLLRVEVRDTGVGVPASQVAGLFEPFTQADASTTRRFGGTGLGLAISREIVHALGGEIGVEPNPGGGSVFWFTALLAPPAGSSVDAEDEYARTWLRGRRALVVDDDERNRMILEEHLAWWGLRTASSPGAAPALAAIAGAATEGDPFDCVLLDLAMPGRDGLDLAEAIRRDEENADLPLLMLTSFSVPDPDRIRTARVTDLLSKPVLAGTLRDALLQHVAGVAPGPGDVAAAVDGRATSHRVLVVEDNPVNQMVALGMLEALGYTAHACDDGVAALELLEHEEFDAVLMDVQMPRLDGYATTRELRAHDRGRSVPVVAMTAAAVEGERERCLAAGMDDFLTKPVDADALRDVLHRWVGPAGPAADVPADVPVTPSEPGTAEPPEGLDTERLDELRDLDPGDTSYLDRAIGNFVTNTPGTFETIRDACSRGDAGTLKQVAHKLAGGALNLGVTPAGRLAQQVELAADTGSTAGAVELVEALGEALERGRAALLAYQAGYQSQAPTGRP